MGDSAHPSVNVFPGLRPFQPDETYLFFGRDGQSDELIRRLARYRFLAVVGSSGSGKSSLVRAGLLASLRGGFMSEAGSGWQIALFRPGVNPVASLAEALCEPGAVEFGDLDAEARLNLIETTLRRSSFGLVEATRQARLNPHQNLVVVVDQFEEIFRLKNVRQAAALNEDEPTAFVKLLLEASNQTEVPIYIVITMRSDFIGDCSEFRGLPEILNRGMYLIPRMTRDQCRQAIEGPIAVGGATVSARLLQRLLNDVGDDPDQLPVLQHALMRTWENWIRRGTPSEPVDLPQYEAIGAMASALSRHADEAYEELDDTGRNMARILFQRLSEKGKDNRESRRPTKLSELGAVVDADEASVVAVIDTFRRDGRAFLAPPARERLGPDSVIEISHESLIRLWDRLRHWAEAEAESAVLYRRLTDTAVRHAAGDAALWQDPELQLALDWYAATQPNQAWAERYGGELNTALQFLELSRVQSARNERVRRAIYYSSVVAAVVFALLGVFAFRELLESRRLSTLNFARQLASQSEIIRNEETGQTQLAALLAIEAARRAPIIETSTRLFDSLHSLPLSRFSFPKPLAGTKVLGALSADGRYAAHLAGEVVTVYDIRHGKQVLELDDKFGVRALALSPEGHFLGIARDAIVNVVEISTNRNLWKHAVVSPVALALSGRAQFAAVSFESRVQVFDTQSDHELLYLPRRADEDAGTPPVGRKGSGRALPHQRIVNEAPRFGRYGYKAIAFSADGRLFAAGGEDVDNAAYELQSGVKAFELSGTRHLTAVAFGPGDDVVAAAGEEISVFDQADGSVRARFRPEEPVVSLAVGPAGRYLAASGERSVQLFDVAGGKRIENLTVDDSVKQVVLGGGGQQLLVETGGRVLAFQDIAGSQIPISDSADARPIALSPNARFLALVNNRSHGMGECRVMEVASGKETARFELPSEFLGTLAVSADGKYVAAVPNARAAVPIIDTATHLQRPDSLVNGQYSAFAFSSDGMSLAAASEDVANGKHETEIMMGQRMDPTFVRPMIPGFSISSLAFSPDGGHLAASGEKSIAVYNTSSRREVMRIHPDADVRNVALTSEAGFLVAAGSRLGIYDVATGAEVMSLPMQSSPESAMALTADGSHVLVASPRAEGIFINRYPSQVQSVVDETCERLDRNLTSEEWARYLSPEPYRKTCINLP
jgi:WD40 repeat protein